MSNNIVNLNMNLIFNYIFNIYKSALKLYSLSDMDKY